eukprot:15466841-Alexandrium_andersonii.AAC.1
MDWSYPDSSWLESLGSTAHTSSGALHHDVTTSGVTRRAAACGKAACGPASWQGRSGKRLANPKSARTTCRSAEPPAPPPPPQYDVLGLDVTVDDPFLVGTREAKASLPDHRLRDGLSWSPSVSHALTRARRHAWKANAPYADSCPPTPTLC